MTIRSLSLQQIWKVNRLCWGNCGGATQYSMLFFILGCAFWHRPARPGSPLSPRSAAPASAGGAPPPQHGCWPLRRIPAQHTWAPKISKGGGGDKNCDRVGGKNMASGRQGGGKKGELLKKIKKINFWQKLAIFYVTIFFRQFSRKCWKTAIFWCQGGGKMKFFLLSSYCLVWKWP